MKDEVQSGYKPAQDDVLKTLGISVIAGQGVEQLMCTCLRFPLHDGPLQTEEQLQALLDRHSKATLGQLLPLLRKKVELHPTFDSRLDRFLQSRNLIAHRLHDVPGGLDLHSDEGRERLKGFLLQFMDDGKELSLVFMGLLRAWAREVGIELPGQHHLSERMIEQVDADVVPQLGDLFRSKD